MTDVQERLKMSPIHMLSEKLLIWHYHSNLSESAKRQFKAMAEHAKRLEQENARYKAMLEYIADGGVAPQLSARAVLLDVQENFDD